MKRHLTLLWMVLNKLWLSRAVWCCLIWCQRYNQKLVLNFRTVLFLCLLPVFFGISKGGAEFEIFFLFYALNVVIWTVIGNFLCRRSIEFLQKAFCSSLFFGGFLADYYPREHPCARFSLIGGRGCSDTAPECHPACDDVCAQGEAGDQRRATGK